jgi:hypothetical protein
MNGCGQDLVVRALPRDAGALLDASPPRSSPLAVPAAASEAATCRPVRAEPNAAAHSVTMRDGVTAWPAEIVRHGPGFGAPDACRSVRLTGMGGSRGCTLCCCWPSSWA